MNETTTGAPLTATVGERLGGDPHLDEARKAVAGGEGQRGASPGGEGRTEGQVSDERKASRRAGGRTGGQKRAARPFPWGALALAVVAWAFATGIGRGIRSRVRRMGAAVREAGQGAWKVARRAG